jgi:hypothetical protein
MLKGLRGFVDDALTRTGPLAVESLATFPPHLPSPTSSTELYSACIKFQKIKTNRITGQPTTTGRAPLILEHFLSKQTGTPLPSPAAGSLADLDSTFHWHQLVESKLCQVPGAGTSATPRFTELAECRRRPSRLGRCAV